MCNLIKTCIPTYIFTYIRVSSAHDAALCSTPILSLKRGGKLFYMGISRNRYSMQLVQSLPTKQEAIYMLLTVKFTHTAPINNLW